MLREAWLRLAPVRREGVLAALGRPAPWHPRFDHRAPDAPGLLTGAPDFVGVGVQKAGTTWWHSLLARHPEVYEHPGFHKERHFFDRFWAGGFEESDVAEYHRWFPRPPGKKVGEWTPDYLHQDWTAPLLARAVPQARVLVLLRDPVERYRSGLAHHRARGERVTPAVAADAFARGLYALQLERLEANVDRGRVLALQYEACKEAPAKALGRTLRFLDLDDTWVPTGLGKPVNPTTGRGPDFSQRRRAELAQAYAPDLARLAQIHPELDLDRWPSARVVLRSAS